MTQPTTSTGRDGVYELLPEYPQDSPEWHEARRQGLGASEVAAVLGLSPWQTPLDVYRSKMGVPNEIPENLAYFGHALEAPIAGWITDKHPEVGPVGDGISARSVPWPWLTATPDRTVRLGVPTWLPIELKTSSAYSKSKWDEGVPLYYQAQVQTQLAVLGAPYGWLAVLHGGNSPELFRLERDEVFIEQLVRLTKDWWDTHVIGQVPPEPLSSAEAVELWPGDPNLTIEGGSDLYDLWDAYGLMQAEAVELQQQMDGTKLALQKAMQDATELTHQGQTLFTWKPRAGSRRFDADALKQANPELHALYMRQGAPTRTFLRKKADNS